MVAGVNKIDLCIKQGPNGIRKYQKGVNPRDVTYHLQIWECPPWNISLWISAVSIFINWPHYVSTRCNDSIKDLKGLPFCADKLCAVPRILVGSTQVGEKTTLLTTCNNREPEGTNWHSNIGHWLRTVDLQGYFSVILLISLFQFLGEPCCFAAGLRSLFCCPVIAVNLGC